MEREKIYIKRLIFRVSFEHVAVLCTIMLLLHIIIGENRFFCCQKKNPNFHFSKPHFDENGRHKKDFPKRLLAIGFYGNAFGDAFDA